MRKMETDINGLTAKIRNVRCIPHPRAPVRRRPLIVHAFIQSPKGLPFRRTRPSFPSGYGLWNV